MKIIFSADYGMGVGDFFVKLYAICHLNKFIKENFHYYTIFILEEYYSNVLTQILNIDFFQKYFDEFYIQHRSDTIAINLPHNNITFNDEQYYKKYSAINNYLINDGRGYWEIYSNDTNNLPINYIDFDYRDPSSRKSEPIPDYDDIQFFSIDILNKAQNFVNNINDNFDCVYYRALGDLNQNHLQNSIKKMKENIDSKKTIFLTSNSQASKNYISSILPNKCLTYNPIDMSKIDGYGTANGDSSRIIDLITEMIVMSYADRIHYSGNHHYISLFTYYAHLVKRVPLTEY